MLLKKVKNKVKKNSNETNLSLELIIKYQNKYLFENTEFCRVYLKQIVYFNSIKYISCIYILYISKNKIFLFIIKIFKNYNNII